jgi:hypothetical protein
MPWFASGGRDRYQVTGTVEGWFGRRPVRRTVTGRSAAKREAARLRRRGAAKVRYTRDGWWAAR